VIRSFLFSFPLLWAFICSQAMGRPIPATVAGLVQRADPQAKIEYCGSFSIDQVDYYLFLLARKELTGVVLVRHPLGKAPGIADADTSLFPFGAGPQQSAAQPMQEAIEELLRRRNLKRHGEAGPGTFNQSPEISAVGRAIDDVVYPISGFRFGTDSTREILRLLRTGPTFSVDPKKAPPGSIIVSPTQFTNQGPIFLGHAGILGSDGSIYSADPRFGGARTKNFTLSNWLRRFSGTNGTYAFVIRAQSSGNPRRLWCPAPE
jgi:hypothetical protein